MQTIRQRSDKWIIFLNMDSLLTSTKGWPQKNYEMHETLLVYSLYWMFQIIIGFWLLWTMVAMATEWCAFPAKNAVFQLLFWSFSYICIIKTVCIFVLMFYIHYNMRYYEFNDEKIFLQNYLISIPWQPVYSGGPGPMRSS